MIRHQLSIGMSVSKVKFRNSVFVMSVCICLLIIVSCNKDRRASVPETGIVPSSHPTPQHAQEEAKPVLQTRDEWLKSSSLADFRSTLLRNIEAGNQDSILSAFSEILEFNPGVSRGPEGVIETWALDGSPEKLEPLSSLLRNLASNGGCLKAEPEDSTFSAPYYNCIPQSASEICDGSGCGIVIAGGAELKKSPETTAQTFASLSGSEIIPSYLDTLCDASFNNCRWRKVVRAGSESGYIPAESLQTKSDGFLWIVKENKGWKIRVLRSKEINWDDT